jgi:hypothetical protein
MAERKTPAQKRKLAKLLADEVPVCEALKQAGWSPSQAAKGYAKVPTDVLKMLPKKAQKLIALGKMDKRDLETLGMGRLAKNIQDGKDGGTQSVKVALSHREINAWVPDQQMGLIILQAPAKIAENAQQLLDSEE